MATIRKTTDVDATRLAALRAPRRDLVEETAAGADRLVASRGPFTEYERTLRVSELEPGRYRVEQTVRFQVAVRWWGLLFVVPLRRALVRPGTARPPWWAPPEVLDAPGARTLGALCTLSMVAGYLGTVITQTITFAADEFHATTTRQGVVLALTRIGIVVTLVLMAAADHRGRRAVTVGATLVACVCTVLGALSPDLWALGATQTIARGATTAVGAIILVMAAEELPAGARAFGVSVLALTAALGAGIAVWVLPVADLGLRAWRLVYLVPIVWIPLTLVAARDLSETRRFAAYARARELALNNQTVGASTAEKRARGLHRDPRLVLLAASAFLVLLFRAPASQLQNEFLRDQRGYDATGITLFTVVTSTPAGLGVLIGGRLADRHGRRTVASIGLALGAVCIVAGFSSRGTAMWVWTLAGVLFGSSTVPSLGTYGPELFATHARGKANGIVTLAGVIGSSIGLVLAGWASDRLGGLGPALALLAIGPALVALLVVVRYPETAKVELEVLNPQDRDLA